MSGQRIVAGIESIVKLHCTTATPLAYDQPEEAERCGNVDNNWIFLRDFNAASWTVLNKLYELFNYPKVCLVELEQKTRTSSAVSEQYGGVLQVPI